MTARIQQLASTLGAKADLEEGEALKLIATFNHEMLGNVEGPDCTDRSVCTDNCCSIMIDIPQLLARRYIERAMLGPGDVRRGDVFAWKLNVRQETNRCAFYSPSLHGCRIYVDDLDARPPQCAVYPAGYTAGAAACKAGAGPWLVKDGATGAACESLMGVFKRYCLAERDRLKHDLVRSIAGALEGRFMLLLGGVSPSSVSGVKETWDGFEPLPAEGRSFSFKQFCDPGCGTAFLECEEACAPACNRLLGFLKRAMPAFIARRDMKEEYTFMELKEFMRGAGEK
ncbi:MAG: hypothetical protein JW839_15305 [Candidatus Lokiarchaeota archaeon]|nr:hypothetical protein [Candidatus Lokiarchaeota archaeon]